MADYQKIQRKNDALTSAMDKINPRFGADTVQLGIVPATQAGYVEARFRIREFRSWLSSRNEALFGLQRFQSSVRPNSRSGGCVKWLRSQDTACFMKNSETDYPI
jgi:hypothetical protein